MLAPPPGTPRAATTPRTTPDESTIGAAMSLSVGPPSDSSTARMGWPPEIAASAVRSGASRFQTPTTASGRIGPPAASAPADSPAEPSPAIAAVVSAEISIDAARAPMRAVISSSTAWAAASGSGPCSRRATLRRNVSDRSRRSLRARSTSAARRRSAIVAASAVTRRSSSAVLRAIPRSRCSLPEAIHPTSTAPASAPSSIGIARVSSTCPGPPGPLITASAPQAIGITTPSPRVP